MDILNQILNAQKEVRKEKVQNFQSMFEEDDNPCWKGFKQLGMKKKNGKEVPNCVPMSKEELKLAGIRKEEVDYSHFNEQNVAIKTANTKAKQIDDLESLKIKHEKEIENLKKRHDRDNDRLAGEKERESENDAISKKRDATRSESIDEKFKPYADKVYSRCVDFYIQFRGGKGDRITSEENKKDFETAKKMIDAYCRTNKIKQKPVYSTPQEGSSAYKVGLMIDNSYSKTDDYERGVDLQPLYVSLSKLKTAEDHGGGWDKATPSDSRRLKGAVIGEEKNCGCGKTPCETYGEEVQERNSDVMKKRNQSQQKAHQKAMMKSAKKSIKDYDAKNKNKNEDTEVEEGKIKYRGNLKDLLNSKLKEEEKVECPECNGQEGGCDHCGGTGYHVTEGKLVSAIQDVIDNVMNKINQQVGKEIAKNQEKGLGMLNTLGSFVGYKVTDKKQEKGKLFLKFGDNMDEELQERDYKSEYENYHKDPEQIKRRAKRNEARRMLKNRKGIKGKDVHHKDNNPMNNDKDNLSIVSQKFNRTEPRLRINAQWVKAAAKNKNKKGK